MALNELFQHMWVDYCHLNPQADAVFKNLTKIGEDVVNDHIAFRTFSHPKISIDKLAHHFTQRGYHVAGEYKFKEKKLNAKHFEHTDSTQPKVFISELDLNQMSPWSQKVLESVTHQFEASRVDQETFLFGGRPWQADYTTYMKLAEESEYAAWVYAHGFRPNHFTVYINYLKKLNTIQALNHFLKEHGFKLNTAGGEIKGSPEEYLEQSSTMANDILVHFTDGTHRIPACYYEFAKRYALPDGKLFQGFIGKSADKIFESTHKS